MSDDPRIRCYIPGGPYKMVKWPTQDSPCGSWRYHIWRFMHRKNDFVASTKRFVDVTQQTRIVVVTISFGTATTVIVVLTIHIVVVTIEVVATTILVC